MLIFAGIHNSYSVFPHKYGHCPDYECAYTIDENFLSVPGGPVLVLDQ